MYNKRNRPQLVLNHVAPMSVAHLTPLSFALFHMSAPPLPRYVPPPQTKPKQTITGVAAVLELLKNNEATSIENNQESEQKTAKLKIINCCCVSICLTVSREATYFWR